eukprot:2636569-Amphidinium_carterae.1
MASETTCTPQREKHHRGSKTSSFSKATDALFGYLCSVERKLCVALALLFFVGLRGLSGHWCQFPPTSRRYTLAKMASSG